MLDANFIKNNVDLIKKNSKDRGCTINIDDFLKLETKRVDLIKKIDRLRNQKNQFKGKPTKLDLERLTKIKEEEDHLSKDLAKIEVDYSDLLMRIPNLTHPDVRISNDESDNPILENKYQPTHFDFIPKDHLALANHLDLIDFDRAAKVTGAKFYYLKNEAALLELALVQYAFQVAIKHGYIPYTTPDLAKKEIVEAMGYSPRDESTQVYNLEKTDLSLIGTAEIVLGGYHKDETLQLSDLPLKYVAL